MYALQNQVRRAASGPSGLLLAATLGLIGCSTQTQLPLGPTQLESTQASSSSASTDPLFLRFDVQAPALENQDTSVVAVAGEVMKLRMLFEGGSGSDRFLELEFDDETLRRYPSGHPRAGTLFQPGDTITITVSIDPLDLTVTLGPEGLEFNPDEPAELELGYRFADPDFDGDGIPDPALEPTIRMFRQGTPGEPWVPLDSEIDLLDDRVEFDDLMKFSRYALAI